MTLSNLIICRDWCNPTQVTTNVSSPNIIAQLLNPCNISLVITKVRWAPGLQLRQVVISNCIALLHCQLEQKRSINTVIWCEGQTTWAAIMSSLKTQILFLPVFSFQLLSPSIISSECPEKPQVSALNVALSSLLETQKTMNWCLSSLSAINGYEIRPQVSWGCAEKRAKESGEEEQGNFQARLLCFICFYITGQWNLTMGDERVH